MVTFLFVIVVSALIPYVIVPAVQHGVESAPPAQSSMLHDGDTGINPAPIAAALAERTEPAMTAPRGESHEE